MADFMQIIDVNESGVERVLHPETNADFVVPGADFKVPLIVDIINWNNKSKEIEDARKGKANLKTKIDEIDTALIPANLLSAIKNVDGSGSGLDADTVDGKTVDDSNDSGTSLWTAAKVISELNKKVNNVDVTTVATANKLLRLDVNGNLPTNITKNSATTTKLQNALKLNFVGDVIGSVTFAGNEGAASVSLQVNDNSHNHNQLIADSLLLNATGSTKIVDFSVNGEVKSSIDIDGNFTGSSAFVNGYSVNNAQENSIWTGARVTSVINEKATEVLTTATQQATTIAKREAQTIVEAELLEYATQTPDGISLGPVTFRQGSIDVSNVNTIDIPMPSGVKAIISESYVISSGDRGISFVKEETADKTIIKINFNKTAAPGTKINWYLTTI